MNKTFFACTTEKSLLDINNNNIVWCTEHFKRWGIQEFGKKINNHDYIYNWALDFGKVSKATEEMDVIFDKVLQFLTQKLNNLHCTDYNCQEWMVILYCWLYYYIQSMYDKYMRIKYAVENYNNIYILFDNKYIIADAPRPGWDYNSNRLSIQQYYDLFSFFDLDIIIPSCNNIDTVLYEPYVTKRNHVKDVLKNKKNAKYYYRKIKRKLNIKTNELIDSGYLCLNWNLLCAMSVGRIDTYENSDFTLMPSGIDIEKRKRFLHNTNSANEFETIIFECLWKNIPTLYVENFPDYLNSFEHIKYDIPKVFLTYTNGFTNPISAMLMAKVLKNGYKINLMQHGGNYGIFKYVGDAEYRIASKYYTWGWKSDTLQGITKFCPMSISKMLTHKKGKSHEKKILFTCYSQPLCYEGAFSDIGPIYKDGVYVDEMEDTILPQLVSIDSQYIKIRPFTEEYDVRRNIINRFPSQYIDFEEDFYVSLSNSSLLVTCLLATTYLEAIALDIPTIVICPQELYFFSDDVKGIIELLRKSDIFVDTVAHAMEIIKRIYINPYEWWQEKDRHDAVNKFKNSYARTGFLEKLQWYHELLKESHLR